jgi:uncharacterized delta-60 repeat protein
MNTKLHLTLLLIFYSVLAFSQPGTLDLTFNATGVGGYGGTPPPAAYQPTAECIVYKSRIYTSGVYQDKIIIIGRFTSFNGVARKYVARLNADGSLDPTFVGPAFTTGYLYVAQILPDNKILVGGVFTVGGFTNFCRLNADGSLDSTFNPVSSGLRGANGEVHALTMQPDGKILVGGNFSIYNTISKKMLRLLENGNPDPTFTGTGTFTGEVRTIALQGTQILVGGFFPGYTGYTKAKIGRLNADGSYDASFNPGGAGATGGTAIFDIKVIDDKIFAGGKFDNYNGANKRSIIRLNSDGTLDPAFNLGSVGVTSLESQTGAGSGYNVFALCVQPDGKILLGGNFTQYNNQNIPKGLCRIYQNGQRDLSFVTGAGFTGGTLVYEGKSVVRDMALQADGKIIAGGDFTEYNTVTKRMLARIITRDCSSSAQYLSGTGWSDGVMPNDAYTFALIYSGTYTIPTGTNLHACELEIKPGATLVVAANASITVEGAITNNGTLIIENSGSLVQVNDLAVNSDLGGSIFTMKRNTQPITRYDYTYWSSPVQNTSLFNVSPNTLSDKFWKWNGFINNWVNIPNGNEAMSPGLGYIIRGPQTFSINVPAVFTAFFTGKPNNGIITQTIAASGASKWNLLGNPYPSAIDFAAFVNAPENAGIAGTAYFWTHATPPAAGSGNTYVYSSNDYATYNLTGYVAPNNFNPTPFNGKIAAGQGFFMEGMTNNSTVTFKNAMRVHDTNNQFFKMASYASTADLDPSAPEKHRLWLNLTNDEGAFNQILVGYLTGATLGFDRNYDGHVFSGNYVTLYSIANNDTFTIQGRPVPFDVQDQVPLGYNTTLAGTFQISLAQFDGLFDTQAVYLKDNDLNVIHDLKESPYSFTSAIGTFDSRFALVYQTESLGTAPHAALDNALTVATKDNAVTIRSSQEMLQRVVVYEVTGKKLLDMDNIQNTEIQITSLIRNNSALLFAITLQNGEHVTKKVLF